MEEVVEWKQVWKQLRLWKSLRQPSPGRNTKNKKKTPGECGIYQLFEEHYSILTWQQDSMITQHARSTRETNSRITMANTVFQKKQNFFQQRTGLKFKAGTDEVLHFEHRFMCCWMSDTSEIRSELSLKFWNVVLEKDEEVQLDRSC